jgi:hypothetical protein
VQKGHPDYWYWGIEESWVNLTAAFADRIYGHQQVTDAYLLGLAISRGAALATLDTRIEALTEPKSAERTAVQIVS